MPPPVLHRTPPLRRFSRPQLVPPVLSKELNDAPEVSQKNVMTPPFSWHSTWPAIRVRTRQKDKTRPFEARRADTPARPRAVSSAHEVLPAKAAPPPGDLPIK